MGIFQFLVGKRSFPYDPFLLSCRDVFCKVFGGFIVYISMIIHFDIYGSSTQSKNPP